MFCETPPLARDPRSFKMCSSGPVSGWEACQPSLVSAARGLQPCSPSLQTWQSISGPGREIADNRILQRSR